MQENNLEPSTSLAQILRESYLADPRVERRHGETGSVDASPHHLLYGAHRGKPEGSVGQEDIPDLSAFLSSEELHKSVNLARQAIGQSPQEERLGDGPHAHNLSPEKRRYPQSLPLSPDRQTQPSAAREHRIKNNRNPTESHSDFERPVRNTPYGPETQSKKEFLNKAADFIEELSSLFKANSSKRIRPRACKAHRSRSNVKTPSDGTAFSFSAEDRERPISLSADEQITEAGDREGLALPMANQLDIQTEGCLEEQECGPAEAECGLEEIEETEICDGGEVEECEAEDLHLAAVQSEEPVPDPPRFIQKLKSREVPEGSKVQLDCIVRGFPVPEVRWFCEGKELENSPDIQILNVGELHSLIIAEAFEEDTGRYSCFASNFYGTDSTSAEIYIEGASSSDSDGEQHFVGVTQVPRKTAASIPVSPPSASVENSVSAQPPVCLPVTQVAAQEVSALPPVQAATSLAAQVSTPAPAQEVSTALLSQEVTTPLSAEGVSTPLPVPVSTTEEVSTSIPGEVSTPLPAQESPLLPAQEVSPLLPIPVSTLLPVQEASPLPPVKVATLLPVQEVSTLLPAKVPTSLPASVSNPFPAQVSNPLPVQVSTPLPAPVSAPLPAQVSTPLPAQVSTPIPVQVSTPIPVQVSNPLPAQVSTPIPVQVSNTLPAQVSTPIPVQVSNPLPAQVSTPIPVQVSNPLPAQVSTPIPVQVSNPLPAQVSTPIPVQVSNPLPAQVSTPIPVQVSNPLPAQVSTPIPVQVSNPLPAQVSTPIPVQVSTPLSAQVSMPLPAQVSTSIPVQVSSPAPIQLVTTQRPFLEGENFSTYPQGLDGRPIMAAPVFTKNLQDVSALEGQLVVLECRVKGVPSPKVDWYREGTLIDDSPDFRILQKKPRSLAESEEICTLVIAEVFPEDSGSFTCTAANKYGTVSSIAQLRVRAKESHSNNAKAASKGTAEFARHKAPEPVSAVLTRPSLKPPEEAVSESRTFVAHPLSSVLKPRTDPAPAVSSALPSNPLCPKLPGSEVSDAEPCPRRVLPRDPPPSILKPKLESLVSASDSPVPPGALLNHAEPQAGPPAPCLKPRLEGVLVNHNEPRSSSRVGLRVHFRLPEDEASEDSDSHETMHKEPPPVLAKPKLDSVQLQLLHNQVLLEQQQESVPQSQQEPPPWSSSTYPEPQPTLNSTATPLSQTVHTSLTNISQSFSSSSNSSSMAQSFSYTRPREFVAAQGLSPVSSLSESLSPTESPVPFLNAMAAQLPQKPVTEGGAPAFFPAANQVTPPPLKLLQTRVLKSPTSPPVSSPPPVPHHLYGSAFPLRPLSPPQASSPTPSGSTPSPIQNPVAFLSSVLPSLASSPPPQTNAMGLPRGAPVTPPQGIVKRSSRAHRSLSNEEIRDSKDNVVQDLERKLRFREDSAQNGQQKPAFERQSGRQLGSNSPVTTFNYNEEYRVSNFEQRLMSEIEFRLERTPVEESDDDIEHDEIPTGKCIAPIFDRKLKNYRAMEGVPVTFTCKIVGIPVPKVYWFKDGKQILKKNVHFKKMREGDGTCALHIEATTNDDDGNYTVMAANPQGRISCSGHLIVQTGPIRSRLAPMIHSQRIRSRVQEADEGEPIQERFFRPHFLQAPGDMLAHEGRVCRLDCKVSGLPNPDLMWLLNGKPILPDFCHRMLVRENGVHSLLIDPLKQSDAGTYTCIATNKAGQSSFCLELSVVAREVKRVPVFVEKLQNTGIAEGSPVRLECRVVGMPPPVIYWKKDNDSIPIVTERLSMHQDATGYVCLLIQPSKKEDAGWYTVSAKNEAGIVSCTARLDIYAQWYQQIPQSMKASRSAGSRYATLASQGLDVLSAFPNMENNPILFTSTPTEAAMESEEL